MLYLVDLAESQVEEEEDELPYPTPVENGGFGLVELLETLVTEGKALKLPS